MTDTEAWQRHVEDLTDWTLARLRNRSDCFGAYKRGQAITVKKPPSAKILAGHFAGRWTVGLHAISTTNTSKWLAIDIDAHAEGDDRKATEAYAQGLWHALDDLELEPALFSSDGNGSFHLLTYFDRPVRTQDVHQFGKWLIREYPAPGRVRPEVFPKQVTVSNGKYGSWLRLPGKHHRRDHWHRAWSDGCWLDAESTVGLILAIEGADPAPVLDANHQIFFGNCSDEKSPWKLPLPNKTEELLSSPPSDRGERNNKLFEAACDMVGRGYGEDEILKHVLPGWTKAGLSENEIRRTVQSACSEPRSPRADPDEAIVELTPDRFSKKTTDTQVATKKAKEEKFLIQPISEVSGGDTAIDWRWYPYLAAGHTTLLTGLWKAGKTTLLAHLLRMFGDGGKLVGNVSQNSVLVISEESGTLWARRRENVGIGDHCHILLSPFLTRPSVTDWTAFIVYLARKVEETGYGLVVFDTVSRWWPVSKENDASQVIAALMPMAALTDVGAAVLLIHHPRKGDGDQGQASRGSGAFPGFVDTILELRRYAPNDPDDCRRTLTCLSRFEEPEPEVVVELRDDGYTCLGSKSAARQGDRMQAITDILPKQPPGMTVTEVREAWPEDRKPGERTLRRDLRTAADDGQLLRDGDGTKGAPYRFSIPAS